MSRGQGWVPAAGEVVREGEEEISFEVAGQAAPYQGVLGDVWCMNIIS